MLCFSCNKEWEPTGHWCVRREDPVPMPPDLSGEVTSLRRKYEMLEADLRGSHEALRRELAAFREEAASGPRR